MTIMFDYEQYTSLGMVDVCGDSYAVFARACGKGWWNVVLTKWPKPSLLDDHANYRGGQWLKYGDTWHMVSQDGLKTIEGLIAEHKRGVGRT